MQAAKSYEFTRDEILSLIATKARRAGHDLAFVLKQYTAGTSRISASSPRRMLFATCWMGMTPPSRRRDFSSPVASVRRASQHLFRLPLGRRTGTIRRCPDKNVNQSFSEKIASRNRSLPPSGSHSGSAHAANP